MTTTFINGAISTTGNLEIETNSANLNVQRGTLITDEGGSLLLRKADGTDQTLVGAQSRQRAIPAPKTSNYTATTADDIILVDASSNTVTILLYTAVGNTGSILTVKTLDATNLVTVDANGTETIDNELTQAISLLTAMRIVSDGSNWWVV